MSDDATGRWGITLPPLERIGVQAFEGFECDGREALDWSRRLRAISHQSGHWPIIIDRGDELAFEPLADVPFEFSEADPELVAKELERWPVRAARFGGWRMLFDPWTGEPQPVRVALIPVSHGWEVPRLLRFGGYNQCPSPAGHEAMWRRWHERYGAELVVLNARAVALAMSRPPRTRAEALRLAWDYAGYCADSVDAVFEADSLAELAAGLIDTDVIYCWWD